MGTDSDKTPWQDPSLPVADRVAALRARMSLPEKLAQLYSGWLGAAPSGEEVAPHQHDLIDPTLDFASLTEHGLGQLTRPFGTAPVDPTDGAKALARLQTDIVAANRFGIPALVHEECLTGFMTWQATVYPTPLAWGATFDPALVERMGAQIGASMRAVGVHQGLAPVLDVTRDPRWGRTEETIGEDPYVVATIGTAYVRGLQSAGVIATLKHFVGYSASTAGRNFGPVAVGPRELADVLLPPFEMAVREGAVGSVMASYTEIDGVPTASDASLLTARLREQWGFTGTVVSDYFGISFLELQHALAGSRAEVAGLALAAGVDVELPAVHCYGEPLLAAVQAGAVDESLVDRAVTRVLTQKCELGLLEQDWSPLPPALQEPDGGSGIDLDPPASRALAQELAEESVVLLANQGALPLAGGARVAVVGPLADDPAAMLGCYSFPSHVTPPSHEGDGFSLPKSGSRRPSPDLEPEVPSTSVSGPIPSASEDADPLRANLTGSHPGNEQARMGVQIGTVLAELRAELPDAQLTHVPGGAVTSTGPAEIDAAVRAAAGAEVCVAVVGDHAGLFGRGTSGEGCDAEDLQLPGQQTQLLAALVETGTPVVAVLLTGRPYALGGLADRLAAIVQAFFPGQFGGAAVAGVLSGRVNPSGRLPVSVPRTPGGQPASYLAPALAHRTGNSSVDPTPLFPFGYGLSYTTFAWDQVKVTPDKLATDGVVTAEVVVRNTGQRAGVEVVQLYLHDPVAQVTRPVVRLVGYARVALEPGQARRVSIRMHADLSSFTGRDGARVVEPGALELRLCASSVDVRGVGTVELVGPSREVDHRRHLTTEVMIDD